MNSFEFPGKQLKIDKSNTYLLFYYLIVITFYLLSHIFPRDGYTYHMAVRGIRGAIQVVENSKEALAQSVPKLISQALRDNKISYEDVISILFTATVDLDADFPAAAARILPLGDIPLICASEIDVPGALPRVVRVMIWVDTDLKRSEITHLYLDGAQSLRQDLAQ